MQLAGIEVTVQGAHLFRRLVDDIHGKNQADFVIIVHSLALHGDKDCAINFEYARRRYEKEIEKIFKAIPTVSTLLTDRDNMPERQRLKKENVIDMTMALPNYQWVFFDTNKIITNACEQKDQLLEGKGFSSMKASIEIAGTAIIRKNYPRNCVH